MLDLSIFFRPWWLFFLTPPDYPRVEGEKLHKLEQHLELLGIDYVKKLNATLAASLPS